MTPSINNVKYNVLVIGIGAMGGSLGRSLLSSPKTKRVIGYDRSDVLVSNFSSDAVTAGKMDGVVPSFDTLQQAVVMTVGDDNIEKDGMMNVVFLMLVNEPQCESVCFGDGDDNLIDLLNPEDCVVLCSTVTATWARKASAKFQSKSIHFIDCPVSGGPARARNGTLTMMASTDVTKSMEVALPLLEEVGKDVHVVEGGAGMGSTVKMVHQLLAGVHIVAAAEALALAAKAGLDVDQMYDIVLGAAGNSWMFADRGKRMIGERGENQEVKSALNIFVKDMDIVHSEAKSVQSPIPLASAALQQFISGQCLGIGAQDDSQVVKVYETTTGISVGKEKQTPSNANTKHNKNENNVEGKEGDEVGDLWKMEDGTYEEILEVASEPFHKLTLCNEYTRVLKVKFEPGLTTLAHRHAEDSLYFFLVEDGLNVINHVKGSSPACDCMTFGEVRYGTHKTNKPLVHKITNKSETSMFCIDAEVLKPPPIVSVLPLMAEHHELVKTRDKVRVYKLVLETGSSVNVAYAFYYLKIVLKGSSAIKYEMGCGNGAGGGISWEESEEMGDVQWKDPSAGIKITNVGSTRYEAYICEWR